VDKFSKVYGVAASFETLSSQAEKLELRKELATPSEEKKLANAFRDEVCDLDRHLETDL
jgi:hypothetical protein